jgi:hypothetical protein
LANLAKAADAAANALTRASGGKVATDGKIDLSGLSNIEATKLANSQPGDPLDNLLKIKNNFSSTTGEQSVFDMFKDVKTASADGAATTADFSQSLMTAGNDVLKLAAAANQGGGALGILPTIISAIGSMVSVGGASGGGGLGGLVGGLLGAVTGGGGGYSAAAQGALDALIATFHTGGVVGQAGTTMRQVDSSIFAGAQRYHGGGAVRGLKTGEVPAILMEDEEVLTRQDPRHRDNIISVGNKQYLMSGTGGSSGGPAVQSSANTTYLQVSVTPPVGGSRESAMQWGAAAGRQMQHAMRRNGS